MPSDSEFDNMEKYVIVMKPLVEITEAIWYRTVGHHRSLLHKLLHMHLVAKSTDSKTDRINFKEHNILRSTKSICG